MSVSLCFTYFMVCVCVFIVLIVCVMDPLWSDLNK